jgi:hypothetical protein
VIRTILASSALGAALLLGGQPAQAVTPLPALNARPAAASVEKVVWVCGPVQCVWDPTPDVGYVAPGYAAAWSPPLYPTCYWKRGFLGRWKMICP